MLLSGGTGLTGQYYATQNLTALKVTRTDPTVNFNWGIDQSPVAGVPGDHFSVRWSGWVQPLFSQTYTFYTRTDDGSRLFVNGQEIINDWTAHPLKEDSGSIRLVAGQKYRIEMDYFQNVGGAQAQLSWSSASQVKQIIPTGDLFPNVVTPPTHPAPTAKLTASNVTTDGARSYQFTVTFQDSVGIEVSSLKTGNVRVVGPNGFSQIATLVSIDHNTNGTPRSATYRITPPGGFWDFEDNGTYSIYLQANQVKDVQGRYASASLLGSFQVTAPGTDWFSTHLHNVVIRDEVRSLDADHSLSRSDMLTIFRSVEGGGVTGSELTDLQTLVNNSAYLGMPDYVRDLSHKIVYGDPANAHYQGHGLGNLYVGSSGVQLETLIGKWFLGKDHPSAASNTHYAYAAGSLFGSGPTYSDVVQGQLGDCYFLAGLGEAAFRDVSAVRSMFIDNGDGTFTVRFYDNGSPTYVTVDRYLPANGNTFWYADFQASLSNPSNKLWVALAEKAYAQLAESGWSRPGSTANAYSSINLGWEGDAVHQIANKSEAFNPIYVTMATELAILNAFNSGRMVAMDTKATTAPDVVANHVYIMVGYNPTTHLVSMYNPWGAVQVMTWLKIGQNFQGWSDNLN
jgi:hypothetical protein